MGWLNSTRRGYWWPFSRRCKYVMIWLIPDTSFISFITKSLALSLGSLPAVLLHQLRLSSLLSNTVAFMCFHMFTFELSLSFFQHFLSAISMSADLCSVSSSFSSGKQLLLANGTCYSHLLQDATLEQPAHLPLNGIHLAARFSSLMLSACGIRSVNKA